MKKGLFDRRIPTLAALIVLLIIVGISTYLIQSGIFYIGKAAPDTQPQNFSITNITDTSFTAVFTTSGFVDAVVNIEETGTGTTLVLDDRDKKSGTRNKYYSHHISVQNLSPIKQYNFKLIVGGKEYNSTTYAVTTGSTISQDPPTQNPLYGKVLLPDGSIGNDSIVIARTTGSQTISAVTDTKGEFILPTNSLRDPTSKSYIILSESTPISLTVNRQLLSSEITTTFAIAQNLPTVTLQQKYTFQNVQEEEQSTESGFNFTIDAPSGDTVTIKRPSQGETFIDQRPRFSGTSYPNSSVGILIPGVAQDQVLTGADGAWTYQSENDIPPGNHTFTLTVSNISNEKTSLTRKFTIFPQGSQVAADQIRPTTSPTPTVTPTKPPTPTPTTAQPTSTPTRTPTPTASTPTPTTPIATTSATPTTAQPTATSTPTQTPTVTPTLSPTTFMTPTRIPTIQTPPGTIENTAILTGISIVLIVAGAILLLVL